MTDLSGSYYCLIIKQFGFVSALPIRQPLHLDKRLGRIEEFLRLLSGEKKNLRKSTDCALSTKTSIKSAQ